jgi:hypothetical protein
LIWYEKSAFCFFYEFIGHLLFSKIPNFSRK